MHAPYWRASTSAFVVDLALAKAGVAVARVHVDTKKGENGTPAFLAINPLGHIPVLVLPDGTVMTESSAIVLRELPLRPYALGACATLLDAHLAMLAVWYAGPVGQDAWRAHRDRLRQDPVFDEVWRRYFDADG